ncbi:hypothetical protein EH223_05685 [candidate division KSB1 bacterium]|nr:hypothetical protein [candidate division KSB1 bacterium]RQW05093.1 MAG: hypothetical protein EH223_05685 [candidate division KSB1 bacterium]
MKRVIIVLVSFAFLLACGKDEPTGPEEKTPSEDSSFFFPLKTGNIWYYYENDPSSGTRSERVWESFALNDTVYFLYGNKPSFADTLYQDQWGRIYKRFGGVNLLWLDFSVENSGTYQYTKSATLDYQVTVTRQQTIEYESQKFEGCIIFEFDAPEIKTEEETIILAPDIGIIQYIRSNGTFYLKSWDLK